jgi:hypothetical protein
MTGFLQRLAERAIGVSHPARAVSTAPFAPALGLADESQQASDNADTQNGSLAAQAYPPAATTLAESHHDQTATTTFDRHLGATAAYVDQTVTPRKMVRKFTATSEPGEHPDVGSASEIPPPIMPLADGKARHQSIDADLGLGSSFHPPDETSVGQFTLPRPAQDAIEPLLPRVREAGRPASSVDHRGRTGSGMVEETTEVHVNIGRIEVTAIHEPAPSQPAAPRRNPPMSLDDYLARRQGGRS